MSEPREQLRERHSEPFSNEFHIQNRNIPLSPLDIRQETPINSDFLGHHDLTPSMLLPELANSVSKASQQVSRHDPASWPVGD